MTVSATRVKDQIEVNLVKIGVNPGVLRRR